MHCEDCLKGKQHKFHMSGKPSHSTRRGEVIHSDVCGPMSVSSLGGSRYFVTFVDAFSGYVTVANISKQNDMHLEFRRYEVWLERRYDCKIKFLHCDGGGEYIGLDSYLEAKVIERIKLPPYSPEQN